MVFNRFLDGSPFTGFSMVFYRVSLVFAGFSLVFDAILKNAPRFFIHVRGRFDASTAPQEAHEGLQLLSQRPIS